MEASTRLRSSKSDLRHPTYRPDIDGLRALAVVAVLGYHLGISWMPGGFVGVDVFFVISGYLIGSIVVGEAANNEFSLSRFYIRRVRRIVPALLFMLAGVLIFSYFVSYPVEYLNCARSALYATLSISNFYFLAHTGYFDVSSASQPLLHTWSLGVEEQFYVVFPVSVIVVFRYARRFANAAILLACVISFAASAYGAFVHAEQTFYLAPTRAWELLLGTLLVNKGWIATFQATTRNVLGSVGLAMILFAVLIYNFELPFPGVTALVPCLGSAFIIAAGISGRSTIGNLLSQRPIAFIGVISYSLYLWHWPIIFFQHDVPILSVGSSRLITRLIAIGCCLGFAIFSWLFVERPFRKPTEVAPRLMGFVRYFACAGLLIAVALVVIFGYGFPWRFSSEAVADASYLNYGQKHFREGRCFIVEPYTYSSFDHQECLETRKAQKNYLLFGDSHAAMLWYGLFTLLPEIHILQATAAGCVPEFTQRARVASSCTQLMNYMFDKYLVTHHVDQLLLVARWNDRDLPGLRDVLAWAKEQSIPVTLFGPMVEYDLALPKLLADAAQRNDQQRVDIPFEYNRELDEKLSVMASEFDVPYVSFRDLLCVKDRCSTSTSEGIPLEFDTDHLTKEGSIFVVQKLIDTKEFGVDHIKPNARRAVRERTPGRRERLAGNEDPWCSGWGPQFGIEGVGGEKSVAVRGVGRENVSVLDPLWALRLYGHGVSIEPKGRAHREVDDWDLVVEAVGRQLLGRNS